MSDAACSASGRPNIGIDIGSIKPWQTVLVGALGLVAAGKPVTGDKRFPGDFSVTLPGIKTGLAQVMFSNPCCRSSQTCCLLDLTRLHISSPKQQWLHLTTVM